MPQYGPFVEVFCETYVHHSVLNIAVVFMLIFSVVITVAAFVTGFRIGKNKCLVHGNAADLLPFLD